LIPSTFPHPVVRPVLMNSPAAGEWTPEMRVAQQEASDFVQEFGPGLQESGVCLQDFYKFLSYFDDFLQ